MNKHFNVPRFVAFLLIIALIIPVNTKAAIPETVQPLSSAYLTAYSAYVSPAANGTICVYYSVFGTEILDSIGALTITVSQSIDNVNWSVFKTFSYSSTSDMLDYNTDYYSSSVRCQGVPGRYYTACVHIWGGKDGDGDIRYYYTNTVRAAINPS